MIGKTIREYKIISEIGEGGMGTVYLAEHSILGKFALKALAPQLLRNNEFRNRFISEAKAQFALKHDNIVQLHTFMEEGDNLFLVMEYIDGDPLDVLIEKKKKLPEKEALLIFNNVLSGLNYAHSKGIIHRDIKPSNILLTSAGTAKIMDFGIAIMASGKRLTKTGTAVGTSWYMSPEQIARPKEIDHRSDVYSLGIILYEMLSGQVPFDGETDYEIYQKHINVAPPDITSLSKKLSPTLAGIIHKALEKNPDDRFDGCGEVLHYIEAYENGDETSIIEIQTKETKADENKLIKERNSGISVDINAEKHKSYNPNDSYKKQFSLWRQTNKESLVAFLWATLGFIFTLLSAEFFVENNINFFNHSWYRYKYNSGLIFGCFVSLIFLKFLFLYRTIKIKILFRDVDKVLYCIFIGIFSFILFVFLFDASNLQLIPNAHGGAHGFFLSSIISLLNYGIYFFSRKKGILFSGTAIVLSWEWFLINIFFICIIFLSDSTTRLFLLSFFVLIYISAIAFNIKKGRINQNALIVFWILVSANTLFNFIVLFDVFNIRWFGLRDEQTGGFTACIISLATGILIGTIGKKHIPFPSLGFFLYIAGMIMNVVLSIMIYAKII